MPSRNATENRTSRYVQGGLTNRYPKRLGWWERDLGTFARRDDDVEVVITPKYDRRPDRLAADYFGRANMAWLVLQYNNIVDINEEFVSGKRIILPEASRASLNFLNKQTGGNKITETS